MDIHTEKLEIFKLILETDDEHIISQIRAIFESAEDADSTWHIDVSKGVERALAEAEAGETIPHELAVTMLKKWQK